MPTFQGLYRALVASVWSGATVHYTGAFWFPMRVDDFWQLIEDFERYQERWPWLEAFTADQDGLVAGNVLRATILPPVPLRLRIQVRFHSCQRLSLTEASITGDLRGQASLSFDEQRGGTRVRADWTLEPASKPVRGATRVARPLVAWGHDRVVDMAVTGLGGTGIEQILDVCGRRGHVPVALREAGPCHVVRVLGDRWGVTPDEITSAFPCDEWVSRPTLVAWRGVTVETSAYELWPWVRQIRLAPYSYDWLDNFGRRSPQSLVDSPLPAPGEFFIRAAGRQLGTILSVDPPHQLTGRLAGAVISYVLRPSGDSSTRLLMKITSELPRPLAPLLSVGDLVMARRQLLNWKALAEGNAAAP